MIDSRKQPVSPTAPGLGKQRSYNEIVEYLDKHWSINRSDKTLERMQKLDQAFNMPSKKLSTILVAGTNGKSLTIHFTTKLLKTEGLKIGAFYAPHVLTYNERLTINHEMISNKSFAELGNEVINTAENLGIQANSAEILTMMALRYFEQQQVDVALLEVHEGGAFNPANICNAKIATVTRVTAPDAQTNEAKLAEIAKDLMGIVKRDTYVISGDQCKNNLSLMQKITNEQGGHWQMPIRKLTALAYPFEQLHGRCAALAERIAQIFVEKFWSKEATMLQESLLVKQSGQRGRPTLETKRQLELNPRRTLAQFWREEVNELPSRFQLLDKEKPSILLDTANNIDALKNLLLGTRLLHYQRPLKGLTIIMGAAQNTFNNEEFLKVIRYFFKKTSGQILLCPLTDALPGNNEDVSWDAETIANDIKTMKIKGRACKNFEEAFELAKKSVDERNGLVVITGSQSIINEYWRLKGIKKF